MTVPVGRRWHRALAESSPRALCSMRRRRFYRGSPANRLLCFEDWMSEPTRHVIPKSARLARPLKRLPMVAAGAALTAVIGAAPVSAQTLTEALSYAYNSNPQLLAQRAVLRQTDEGVPQALSNWRPTVTFTGEAGIDRGSINEGTGDQFSTFRTRELDLRLTQPVYRGGRTEAQTRQAINLVQSARAQTLAVETTVFQAVMQAFFDTFRD